MPENDRIVSLFIEQMRMQNELAQEMRDEIHKLSNAITGLTGEITVVKKELYSLDEKLKGLDMISRRHEADLQKLEPIIEASKIVKGLIIKAMAYGALAVIILYIGREVNWKDILPFK